MIRVTSILLFSFLFLKLSAHWVPVTPVNESALILAEKGDSLFAGAYGGLYQSTNDGVSCQKVTSKTPPFYNINGNLLGLFIHAAAYPGLLTKSCISDDAGNIWNAIYDFTSIRDVLTIKDKTLLVDGLNIYTSINNGKSWVSNHDSLLRTLKLSYDGNNIYLLSNDAIYISKNTGESWEKSKFNLNINPNLIASTKNITYVSENGKNELYFTKDKGENWEVLNSTFNDIRSLYSFENNILVCTLNDIFLSKDEGQSWKSIKNNLSFSNQISYNFIYYKNKLIVCGEGLQLNISNDEFTDWTEIESSNYNFFYNHSIAIKNDVIYLAEGNQGIFKRDLNEILLLNNTEIETTLLKVYPNPSNDLLYFNLNDIKKIILYNPVGTIIKEIIPTTNYIDIQSLNDGLYFIKLETNNSKFSSSFIKK